MFCIVSSFANFALQSRPRDEHVCLLHPGFIFSSLIPFASSEPETNARSPCFLPLSLFPKPPYPRITLRCIGAPAGPTPHRGKLKQD